MIIMVITINMIFLISSLSPCLIITFVSIIIFGAKHSILIGHFLFFIHFICLIFVAKHSSVIGQGECGGCHSDTHIRLLARIHSHIHIHTQIHIHAHTYTYTYTHRYTIHNTHTHRYTHTQLYVHIRICKINAVNELLQY